MSNQKGATYERELVNQLFDAGWGALRLGASGSGGNADLPDVFAGRERELSHDRSGAFYYTECLAVELKSGKANILYVDADEVDALERFARRWGATPLLGARFTTRASPTETFLVSPDDARQTDGGNYGLPAADIDARASWSVSDAGIEWL